MRKIGACPCWGKNPGPAPGPGFCHWGFGEIAFLEIQGNIIYIIINTGGMFLNMRK
jgi:hypothetical protein